MEAEKAALSCGRKVSNGGSVARLVSSGRQCQTPRGGDAECPLPPLLWGEGFFSRP